MSQLPDNFTLNNNNDSTGSDVPDLANILKIARSVTNDNMKRKGLVKDCGAAPDENVERELAALINNRTPGNVQETAQPVQRVPQAQLRRLQAVPQQGQVQRPQVGGQAQTRRVKQAVAVPAPVAGQGQVPVRAPAQRQVQFQGQPGQPGQTLNNKNILTKAQQVVNELESNNNGQLATLVQGENGEPVVDAEGNEIVQVPQEGGEGEGTGDAGSTAIINATAPNITELFGFKLPTSTMYFIGVCVIVAVLLFYATAPKPKKTKREEDEDHE